MLIEIFNCAGWPRGSLRGGACAPQIGIQFSSADFQNINNLHNTYLSLLFGVQIFEEGGYCSTPG